MRAVWSRLAGRSRRARFWLPLFCTLAVPIHALAADRLAEPLSLADCVELAEHNAPLLMSQQARALDAQAQLSTAKTLPNPIVSYLAQDIGLHNAAGTPQLLHQAMISIPLLRGIVTAQEARTASAQRDSTQQALAEELRQLRLAVGRAFFELRLYERLVAIEQQAVDIATALLHQNQQRELRGDASALDILRAQAEQLDAQRGEELASRQQRLLQLAFSILLGAESPRPIQLRSDSQHDFAQQMERSSAGSQEQALSALLAQTHERPDLRQAVAEIQHADAAIRLAQLRSVPLFDLQASVGARFSNLGPGAVVALSTPLPLLDFGNGPRQRAQSLLLQAKANQLRSERQVQLDIASSYHLWQRSRDILHKRARPLCDARRQALTATEKQFAAGVTSLLDLITAQRDLLAAQRAEAMAQRDVEVSLWQLQMALGR